MQSTHATPGQERNSRDGFWERSAARLRAHEVTPTALRWYVIRAEHSLQAVSQKQLTEPTPQDVTDSLEKLGSIGSMAAWQHYHAVDAIQHLWRIGNSTALWRRQLGSGSAGAPRSQAKRGAAQQSGHAAQDGRGEGQ